jgi:hypothetical protein
MKNFLATFLISLLLINGTMVNATDCKLGGVDFSGLNNQQVKVLSEAGGKCSQSTSSFNIGDKSYFVIDGQRQDFIDIKSEDPWDLKNKKFSYTGYVGWYMTETERNKVWGYRFDARLDEGGGFLKGLGIMNEGETIPLLAYANENLTIDQNKLARKSIYKFFNKAKQLKAVVEITGMMKNFSNSGDLYLELDTYKIIQTIK